MVKRENCVGGGQEHHNPFCLSSSIASLGPPVGESLKYWDAKVTSDAHIDPYLQDIALLQPTPMVFIEAGTGGNTCLRNLAYVTITSRHIGLCAPPWQMEQHFLWRPRVAIPVQEVRKLGLAMAKDGTNAVLRALMALQTQIPHFESMGGGGLRAVRCVGGWRRRCEECRGVPLDKGGPRAAHQTGGPLGGGA